MKKSALLPLALCLSVFLFGQTPFAPVGAKWGATVQCYPSVWPCPPEYPLFTVFEVTEDTIIQGKYCTLIAERDWNTTGKAIVHQDGQQIYRYDRVAEEFMLVLDFSKEVGESWQIEVPEYWTGSDTLTVTVTAKDGAFREVSVGDDELWFTELPLYEGFGGVFYDHRLLLGDGMFIIADPIIRAELTCYMDPTEGLLFGEASACEPTNVIDQASQGPAVTVFPNPTSSQITLECKLPFAHAIEWTLHDAQGRIITSETLAPLMERQSLSTEHLPAGLYYWKVQAKGQELGAGKIVVLH